MKRRLIVIAIVLAVLALFGFRYMIVEQNDVLPDEVRLSLKRLLGVAMAETVPAQPTETPVVTFEPTPEAEETENIPEPTLEPAPEPEAELAAEPVLEKGDSGEEVRALQKRLRELGFMTGAADGKFGPKTEQAVIEFKKHLHELEQERMAAEQAAAEQAAADALSAAEPVEDIAAETSEDGATEPVEDGTATSAEDGAATPAEGGTAETIEENTGETIEENAAAPSEGDAAESSEDGTDAPAEGGAAETIEENAAAPSEDDSDEPVFDGSVDEEIYRLLVEKEFDEYQTKLLTGSRGAEVRRMQTRLKTLGYLTGKADGIFGKQTVNAVKAFQKQHKLTQDGIAGEKTQRALYSESAKKYVAPTPVQGPTKKDKPYFLKVSTKDQRVYAYSWNAKDGAYTNLVRTMVCSTGLAATPTPKGTYTSTTPVVRWGYFPKYDVWAQYLYRISGPYLFHSVLYDEADESTVKWGSVNKLGSPASHGCIRLSVEDARWIYNNCPAGTTVTVY